MATEKKGDNEMLAQRIQAACSSTSPKTRERMNALAAIRWVLRDQNGNYAALGSKGSVIAVESINEALVFDGRDNEEMKRGYYRRITGMDYTVELL